ncbi:LysR family transcriptional regulator [Inquilinus sp. Marseille-Q2685]|uniref:LysR family transcriptional regulator n=1 Tax=Inquilinus sp. Marseille-Q2685 TaxID=2866581 RepID=UPI001CE46BFD|nr:LysR family transcriptional regulator [Inquilinus sp. Marseille-Q2685]
MAVDLNHLILFSRVVRAGSFSGAARMLGLPKATVSRNIARLEEEIGARLLHRTTRKIELTSLGRAYLDEVDLGLRHLEAASERVAATQRVPSGTLRLTAPVYFGVRYLIEWVAEFCTRFPDVKVELHLSDDYVDLIERRIDIAIRTGRLSSSSLVARKLGPAKRIVVASPGYLSRRGTPRSVGDLPAHDAVVLGPSVDNAAWRLDGPQGPEEVHMQGRIAVNSAQAALRAAVAGLGLALLPTGVVQDDLDAGRLRQVLKRHGVDSGGLYAVYASGRHPTAAHRALLDFLAAKLRVRAA